MKINKFNIQIYYINLLSSYFNYKWNEISFKKYCLKISQITKFWFLFLKIGSISKMSINQLNYMNGLRWDVSGEID